MTKRHLADQELKKKHVSSYSVRSFQFKMLKFFSVKQKNMIGIVGLCGKLKHVFKSIKNVSMQSQRRVIVYLRF